MLTASASAHRDQGSVWTIPGPLTVYSPSVKVLTPFVFYVCFVSTLRRTIALVD